MAMIKIGPVTPEITRVTTAPFWRKRQKSAYPSEYISKYWTVLTKFLALVDICMEIIKLTCFVARCYGNRFISGAFCRRQNWLPLLFAPPFRNGM